MTHSLQYTITLRLTYQLIIVFLSLFSLLASPKARAEACHLDENAQADFVMPKVISINPGLSAGSALGPLIRKTYTLDCTKALSSNNVNEGYIVLRWRVKMPSHINHTLSSRYVIPTNVRGISLIITIYTSEYGMSTPSNAINQFGTSKSILMFNNTGKNENNVRKKQVSISAQFMQTMPSIPNITDIQPLLLFDLEWITQNAQQSVPIKRDISTSGTTRIQLPACSIQGPAIRTVVLPEIYQDELHGIGAITAKGKKFSIKLNCHTNTDIYITFSSAQVSPALPTVLESADAPEAATGVGIQLRIKDPSGDPIAFDQKQLIPLKQQKIGERILRFYAHYFQTQAQITPGTINSTATFIIDYQ